MSFTVEEGIKIQQADLARWKERLSAVCYEDLVIHIRAATYAKRLTDGYDVPRGNDLTEFVASWTPKNRRTA